MGGVYHSNGGLGSLLFSILEEEKVSSVWTVDGDFVVWDESTIYNSWSAAHSVKKHEGSGAFLEDTALTGITGSTKVANIPMFEWSTKSVIHVSCRTGNETSTHSCKSLNWW